MERTKMKKLIVIFILLAAAALINGKLFAEGEHLIKEKSFNVSSGELLEMDVAPGDVNLESWGKDEVFIAVYGNDNAEEKIELIFKETSEGIYVETERENSWNWFNNIRLRFDVKVPEEFDLSIKTAGGDVKISDLTGEAVLKSSGGDIVTQNTIGEYVLSTSGGDVIVNRHKGDIKAGTSGGDVSCRKVEGNLSAKTSGGDIKIGVAYGEVEAKTSGGDIELYLSSEFKGASLGTSGGDIDVLVKGDIKADLNLYTSGGDVEVDVRGANPTLIKKHKYEGTLNGGGPKLMCKTSGGDISLTSR